jgi:hypothetical protein
MNEDRCSCGRNPSHCDEWKCPFLWQRGELDRSFTVAAEHVRWCRRQGMTARDILDSIDEDKSGDWDWIIGRVAAFWRERR